MYTINYNYVATLYTHEHVACMLHMCVTKATCDVNGTVGTYIKGKIATVGLLIFEDINFGGFSKFFFKEKNLWKKFQGYEQTTKNCKLFDQRM